MDLRSLMISSLSWGFAANRQNHFRGRFLLFGISAAVLLAGCSSGPILRPAVPPPPQTEKPPPSPTTEPQTPIDSSFSADESLSDDLDFSVAFQDTAVPLPPSSSEQPDSPREEQKLRVGSSVIRVALKRNVSETTVYAVGNVSVVTRNSTKPVSLRGSFRVKAVPGTSRAHLVGANGRGPEISLPCTLRTEGAYSFFEVDESSYRGYLVLHSESKGRFTVVNHLPVEAYLRGVVLLEIGKRPEEEIEAVKAQAIAARTYSYKRMSVRKATIFDVLPTVSDQVYGGLSAESRLTDKAIRQTQGIVLCHADTLIHAYYHSTCGGITARIEDVWDKPPAPYLVSIRDQDRDNPPYCSISRYFTWEESWPMSVLSSLVSKYYPVVIPNVRCEGMLRKIEVTERFECGRVKTVNLTTSKSVYSCGGDKTRFILRRNEREHPILRSANFAVHSTSGRISLQGKGYGHGVGMCQMGAVGRARAGQSFAQILHAYYTDTSLQTILPSD